MPTSADLRDSELEKFRDLLSRATDEDSALPVRPPVDLALSLLSNRDNVRALVGRTIADALHD